MCIRDSLNCKRFTCTLCNVSFETKSKYERHLNTQKHINLIHNSEINNTMNSCKNWSEENVYKAKYMELSKKYYDLEKSIEIRERNLQLRLEKLEHQLSISSSNVQSNCNNNNVNTTINITNNVNLPKNAHGSENWDYLKSDILNIMKGVNTCIPEIVKKIHFDKDHPENHNIKIPNKKLSQAKTFNGETWNTVGKREAIETLIVNVVDRLQSEYGGDFNEEASQFIQKLWAEKMGPIFENKTVDRKLRNQVEYTIIDNQSQISKSN